MAPLAWAALGAGACFLVAPFEPNMLEEGILLHVAQRIAHGERLYRDVLAFTGPLPFQALALLFRVFGEEIWIGRAAWRCSKAQRQPRASHRQARRRRGARTRRRGGLCAGAAAALPPCSGSLLHDRRLPPQRALDLGRAAGASSRGLGASSRARRRRRRALQAADRRCPRALRGARARARGARHPRGAIRQARRLRGRGRGAGDRDDRSLSRGGHIAPMRCTRCWCCRCRLGDLRLAVPEPVAARRFSPRSRGARPSTCPTSHLLLGHLRRARLAHHARDQALYAIPLAALALTALRRTRGALHPAAWLHTALLCTWLVNLYPRTDWGHLVHVLPPAVAQLCICAATAQGEARRTRRRIRGRGRGPAAARGGCRLGALADPAQPRGRSRLQRARAAAPGEPRHARPARAARDRLPSRNTEPGDPIFVARAEPLLYFATGTRNPTPYPGVIPGMREEQSR